MADPTPVPPDLTRLRRHVQQLRSAVYAQQDPTADAELLAELEKAEAALRDAESKPAPPEPPETSPPAAAPAGRLLGPETTGLKVDAVLNMNPVPTAIYPLLDPDTDPLLTVTVTNVSLDAKAKRVRVRAWIEGLSAEAVRTAEIRRGQKTSPPLKLLPLLFPERARLITEVQRATLHLQVEELDPPSKIECHDTFSLVLLARTSGLNAVTDPTTGGQKDLTHYYGAWVTPHTEAVQERVRRAAALHPAGMIAGYIQGGPEGGPERVREQARALYQALKECELAYISSVTDYGAGPGALTQRARLPGESLARKSANCLDGTVLFASLLEGAGLSPALLVIPGHALAGWESDRGTNDWQFVETTMIGGHEFDAALASGQKQYQRARDAGTVRLHRLADLRARGIWPME